LPYATNQCADCPPGTGIDDLEVYERNSATPEIYKARKTITFLSEYTDERYRDYSAIIEAGLALCTPQCNVQPPLNTSDADIYIRDATGNVLAVYHYDRKTAQLRWSEQHLYGSARLGMYLPEKSVISVSTDSKQREVGYLGKQIFELSNHLGNVLATITDKKLQVSTNTTSTAYFEADVQTVQDYYAFGMQMPGRKLSGGYRYGFNGKENDLETTATTSYDFGFRIYSPAIGRFLSTDPLTKGYPMLTPYQYASNNPILNIDLDGLEGVKATDVEKKTITIKVDVVYVLKQTKKEASSNLDASQLETIKKNLNKELNKEKFKDEITGYDVKFEINFKQISSMGEVNRELADNNDIQDNRMFLKLENQTDLGIITDADGNEFQKTKQGASNWRFYNITNSRDGHTLAHELFHNLTHNHKNAPIDIQTQIDPSNQKPGHKAAGGIFIYEDARDGSKKENINQKNIQDVLRSLPEEKKPITISPVQAVNEPPKG
jgi:RHS repeat-associated protein